MNSFILALMAAITFYMYGGGGETLNSLKNSLMPEDEYVETADEEQPTGAVVYDGGKRPRKSRASEEYDEDGEPAAYNEEEYDEEGDGYDEEGGYADNEDTGGVKIMMNPLMVALIDLQEEDIEQWIMNHISAIELADTAIKSFLILSALSVAGIMALTSRSSLSPYSHLLARLGFSSAKLIIFFASVGSVVGWLAFRYNTMLTMSGAAFTGPLALLIGSAIALKIYDFNTPFWKSMFFSFFMLLCSSAIIKFV